MSKFMQSSTPQSLSSPKKTGAYTITPVILICAACDAKYFDAYSSSGGPDNTFRLNQIFLDSLAIEAPANDTLTSSLNFCPTCSLKLNELDCLMSKMENLQMRIQTVKDFMCATVTNTAFQCKYGLDQSSSNGVESLNSFVTTIRDQVMQNWITLSRSDDNDNTPKVEPRVEKARLSNGCPVPVGSPLLPNQIDLASRTTPVPVTLKSKLQQFPSSAMIYENPFNVSTTATTASQSQLKTKKIARFPETRSAKAKEVEHNALEIFDELDHEDNLQGTEQPVNRGSMSISNNNQKGVSTSTTTRNNSSPSSNTSYVSILADSEEVEITPSKTIKLEPSDIDSWGVISSVQSFSNSTATSPEVFVHNDEESILVQDHDIMDPSEDGERSSPEQEESHSNEAAGGMSTLFYDESDSASGFIYNTTTTIELQDAENEEMEEDEVEEDEESNQVASSVISSSSSNLSFFHNATGVEIMSAAYPGPSFHQQQHHHLLETTSHKPSILRSTRSRAAAAAKQKTKEKSLDIQMCTLCYKYVVTGVKHNCEEKSTTTMYQCGYCNAVFHSERVLQEHIRRHIRALEFPVTVGKSVVQCRLCKMQFPSPSKLAIHMKDQHGTDVIRCQICPKVFKDVSSFRIHMIAHTSTKDSEMDKLSRYQRTDDKSYPCELCGKTFRLHNDLRRHILIHTGERPFRCHMCDKAFNRKHHLTTHLEHHRKNQNQNQPMAP